jgi:hypothetical protein
MFAKHPKKQGGAAAMETAYKDKLVGLSDFLYLPKTQRLIRICSSREDGFQGSLLHFQNTVTYRTAALKQWAPQAVPGARE